MKSIFESMGGTYTRRGDYLIPNIAIPPSQPIGIWGRRRRQYLKEHREVLYSVLFLSGQLDDHLSEADRRAEEMYDRLTTQMAAKRGITEQLKTEDPMRWVGEMNNIRAAVEEIIFTEVIYA